MASDSSGGPVLVFDSGLGGLSVVRAIRALPADLPIVYVADDAAFPYGDMAADALLSHVCTTMERLIDRFAPSAVVIACNTISTLVLDVLRSRHDVPFVGTVPAIKPAAEQSRSGVISVLATPGTVERDYTSDLIARFAGHCHVKLVGAPDLARLAENHLRGAAVDADLLLDQVRPCFYEVDGRRADIVVLACTHYPFLIDRLAMVAPWPVIWLDPAPAIASRLADVLAGTVGDVLVGVAPQPAGNIALMTSGRAPSAPVAGLFAEYGLDAAASGD